MFLYTFSALAYDHEEYRKGLYGTYQVTYTKGLWPLKKKEILTFTIEDRTLVINTKQTGRCSGEYSFGPDSESYGVDAIIVGPIGKLDCENGEDWIIARILFPKDVTPNEETQVIKGKIDILLNGIYRRNSILYKNIKIKGPNFLAN